MVIIAASRIQKAMARVRASSPFARPSRAPSRRSRRTPTSITPDARAGDDPPLAVVIFSSDRGLAGAFNSQIRREALQLAELLRSEGREPVFYLVGRKAVGYFSSARWRARCSGRATRTAALPHRRAHRRRASSTRSRGAARRTVSMRSTRLQPFREHDDARAGAGASAPSSSSSKRMRARHHTPVYPCTSSSRMPRRSSTRPARVHPEPYLQRPLQSSAASTPRRRRR